MIPINNSNTAWLIVSDFNQDNSLPYEDLRADIYCPSINDWHYDHNQMADPMTKINFPEKVGNVGSTFVGEPFGSDPPDFLGFIIEDASVGGCDRVSRYVGGNYAPNQ